MMKVAKLDTQAFLPEAARPPAMPTMFDSAMPALKNRLGNFLADRAVRVELLTSPSTTTICGYLSATCARARPNASRIDFPIFIVCLSEPRTEGSSSWRRSLGAFPDGRAHGIEQGDHADEEQIVELGEPDDDDDEHDDDAH